MSADECHVPECVYRVGHGGAHGPSCCVGAAARERRRLRAAIRTLRRKWAERMGAAVPGHFDGAARAVQALDEAMRAMKAPRRSK